MEEDQDAPPKDRALRYIDRADYREHEFKIARRGGELRVLIYPPYTRLATRMVLGDVLKFQETLHRARLVVDQMVSDAGEEANPTRAEGETK